MVKVVKYNGGTESWYSCTNPDELVIGKEYEVYSADDKGWQTNYRLKGIAGEFNSAWFDVVESVKKPTFMALSHNVPIVGKNYECFQLNIINGKPQLTSRFTSQVKEIQDLGNDIYRVTTRNSVYIVQIG